MIHGAPLAQKRHRHAKSHKGNVWAYDPLAREKATIKQDLMLVSGVPGKSNDMYEYPDLYFRFYMPIPKSMSKRDKEKAYTETMRHIKKPDNDNLSKLYLDCLSGVFFHDDNRVKIKGAMKVYSPNPRVEIEIHEGSEFEDAQETDPDAFQDYLECGIPRTDPKRIPTFWESPTY